MHASQLINEHLAKLRGAAGKEELVILETGSIRADRDTYRSNDGWSTLTFAENVRDHGGELYSIDLDTRAADKVLTRYGVRDHVELIEGYSIEVLAGMLRAGKPLLDVAYLDSDNDDVLILHEFLLVEQLLDSPGLVLIDDVDPESDEVVKGRAVVPWLTDRGVPWRLERRTGNAYRTGVLVVEA
jgi:hypothetical protein